MWQRNSLRITEILPKPGAELIVGNPSVFAIESSITRAYERLSLRALGLFVIHIGGSSYGQLSSNSTMLACSFDEVARRIASRGGHTVPFASEPDAGKVANAVRNALYAEQQHERYFGVPRREFIDMIRLKRVVWAPDGDEAFDDSSYVLQFDVGNRVRLIAFKCGRGVSHDPDTIHDVWLETTDFYHTLQHWYDAFQAEWTSAPKLADAGAS
jgi:hypothetical protein